MKSKRSPSLDLEEWVLLLIQAWRKLEKETGPKDRLQTREFRKVVEKAKELQHNWDGVFVKDSKDLLSNKDYIGAYLLYQWQINYQQGISLIGELKTPPEKVLDIGAGLCPFSIAALKWGAKQVLATDKNNQLLEIGASLAGRFGYPLTIRQWDCFKKPLMEEGPFDLIILGHCLRELFPEGLGDPIQLRKTFIQGLTSKLSEDGAILIVDSSHPVGNDPLLALRDALVEASYPVQAPCIYKGPCPARLMKTPCYAQRPLEKSYLLKEIQRAAEINLSSLKMSYLIVRHPRASWPKMVKEPVYRVISPPFDSYLGKRYYLCGTDGKRGLESGLTEFSKENRAFEFLKRGEAIFVEDAAQKKEDYIVSQNTTIEVLAPIGKPIPEA